MPGITPPVSFTKPGSLKVIQHDTATDFLSATYTILRRHERSSNLVFAHALQRARWESAVPNIETNVFSTLSLTSSSLSPHDADSFWLTVWSSSTSSTTPTLDFVLSCVSSTLGNYPIFLWTPRHSSITSLTWLAPRIIELTQHLHACVHPKRVFSVFGKSLLVKMFCSRWIELTGSVLEPEPFYAAYYTFCTPCSLKESDHQIPADHFIRRATIDDLDCIAQFCREFANSSIFFPLTDDRACIEAKEMIYGHKVWVYEAVGEIASICALGRDTPKVVAITKVFTTSRWRRHGFAEHLVRHVTQWLLASGKDSVVLYAAYACGGLHVYNNVGFVGLIDQDKPEGVEDVLELGFVGTDRGHW